MKFDSRGHRIVRTPIPLQVRDVCYDDDDVRALVRNYEEQFLTKIVAHPRGIYVGAYTPCDTRALAVVEYADFGESRERDIFAAFPRPGRMGKIAFYYLLDHVVRSTPKGWKAAGFVAWNHAPMHRMMQQNGFAPKLIMYTKEAA